MLAKQWLAAHSVGRLGVCRHGLMTHISTHGLGPGHQMPASKPPTWSRHMFAQLGATMLNTLVKVCSTRVHTQTGACILPLVVCRHWRWGYAVCRGSVSLTNLLSIAPQELGQMPDSMGVLDPWLAQLLATRAGWAPKVWGRWQAQPSKQGHS